MTPERLSPDRRNREPLPAPPGKTGGWPDRVSRLSTAERVRLAFLLAVGLGIRLYRLGHASVWLDEAMTVKLSSLPLSTLWVSAYDSSPPLYYSVIKLLAPLGQGEFLLRLPSALFGTLTTAVVYFTARRLAGSVAAFAAALLLALSVPNLEYSQEARHYALLGLCLSVSLMGLVRLGLRWSGRRDDFSLAHFLREGAMLYAAGLIAALYTHNVAVFYWLAAQCFFLAWWARPFRCSRAVLGAWFGLNLAVLLLWLPWFLTTFEVAERGYFNWLRQAGPERAFDIWRAVHGFGDLQSLQPWADLLLLGLGLGGLYTLRRNVPLAVLFTGLLAMSSLGVWAYGLVGTPVFMFRTLLWGTLPACLLAGLGVQRLPGALPWAAMLILAAAAVPGVYGYFSDNRAESEDWRSAADYFVAHQQSGDIVLLRNSYVAAPFFYYVTPQAGRWQIIGWNCRREEAYTGVPAPEGGAAAVHWNRRASRVTLPIPPRAGATLWVVESHCQARDWRTADGVFLPNWQPVETLRFKQVLLHRLVPRL